MKRFISEIIAIFKDTPKITKDFTSHDMPHSYQVLDELLIKHKLRELFAGSHFQIMDSCGKNPPTPYRAGKVGAF